MKQVLSVLLMVNGAAGLFGGKVDCGVKGAEYCSLCPEPQPQHGQCEEDCAWLQEEGLCVLDEGENIISSSLY